MKISDTPQEALLQSIFSGNCVLFLGAGLGFNLFNESGNNCPDGNTLARMMLSEFSIEYDSDDLSLVSEVIEVRKNRGIY